MYGERRDASDGDVASWLERVGVRLRELEAENARLKQELADLRRGAGIALMIDGHVLPLALQTPAEQAPAQQSSVPAHQSRPSAAHLPPALAPLTGPVPIPTATQATVAARAAHGAHAQPAASASRRSFGPLACTPDELPAVRGLVPTSRRPAHDWLGAGDAWPDATTPARHKRPAATLRSAITPVRGTYPPGPARPGAASAPLWRDRTHGHETPNPYADSFIL